MKISIGGIKLGKPRNWLPALLGAAGGPVGQVAGAVIGLASAGKGAGAAPVPNTSIAEQLQRQSLQDMQQASEITKQYWNMFGLPQLQLRAGALQGLTAPVQATGQWLAQSGPWNWGFGKTMEPPTVSRPAVEWGIKPEIGARNLSTSLPSNVTTQSLMPTMGILGGMRSYGDLERYAAALPQTPDWKEAGERYGRTMSAAALSGVDRQANQLSAQAADMLARRGLQSGQAGAGRGIGLWARRTGAELEAQNLQNRLGLEAGLREEQARRAQAGFEIGSTARQLENNMLLARQQAERLTIEAENARRAGDFERARQLSEMANEQNYRAQLLGFTVDQARLEDWYKRQGLIQDVGNMQAADLWAAYQARLGERNTAKQDYLTLLNILNQTSGQPESPGGLAGALSNIGSVGLWGGNQTYANALAARDANNRLYNESLSTLMTNLPSLWDYVRENILKKKKQQQS